MAPRAQQAQAQPAAHELAREARRLEALVLAGGAEAANHVGALAALMARLSGAAEERREDDGGDNEEEGEEDDGESLASEGGSDASSASQWSDEEGGADDKSDGASDDEAEGAAAGPSRAAHSQESKSTVESKLAVLHSSRRCFAALLERGDLRAAPGSGEALATYRSWLEARYSAFLRSCCELLGRPQATYQVAALRTLMLFVQKDYLRRGVAPKFGLSVMRLVVSALVGRVHKSGGLQGQLLRVLQEEFLEPYLDCRLFALTAVRDLCVKLAASEASDDEEEEQEEEEEEEEQEGAAAEGDQEDDEDEDEDEDADPVSAEWAALSAPRGTSGARVRENLFDVLYCIPATADKALFKKDVSWLVAPAEGARLRKRGCKQSKKAFQVAWVAFLRVPRLPAAVQRRVLLALPQRVTPHLLNPLLLSDFLTEAYDLGGVTAVMALQALFMLISEHGLDYPEFYPKLYAVLDLGVMHAKHRGRFFDLLDKFLGSSHLASYLVAAFAKKVARLALFAPPGPAMFAVVLLSNLLKKHPTCLSLVHMPTKEERAAQLKEPPSQAQMDDINREKRAKLDAIKEASLRLALGAGAKRFGERGDDDRDHDHDHGGAAAPAPAQVAASGSAGDGALAVLDPFDLHEPDPARSNALESCLWEVEALARHYSPSVSLLVKSLFHVELKQTLETRKVMPPAPLDDVIGLTYKQLFDREIKKARKKRVVPLTFENAFAPESKQARTGAVAPPAHSAVFDLLL